MMPLKVMTVGLDPEELPKNDRIMWIAKGPKSEAVGETENYIMTRKMVGQIDLMVINCDNKYLSFGNGVILQLAYSNSTPIFAVGPYAWESEFLGALIIRHFDTLDDLVDHLQALYC